MELDQNSSHTQDELSQFLEKFQEPDFQDMNVSSAIPAEKPMDTATPSARTFEKLEQKIQELEEKFDASEQQNEMILAELAHTREHLEHQQNRDLFVEHLSQSIAKLRASVESLTRAQQHTSFAYRDAAVQRSFDDELSPAAHTDIYQYEPDNYRYTQALREEQQQQEKERIIARLHQKASQLKAVNSALDREIKKVQQEKLEALKKSAEQAKEILSLRDQLTQAEERFKSFDFEGRIISIRQEYQQRVSSLETQLQEISDICMKQVEEIETLRSENIKLQHAALEKEQLLAQLEEKERELSSLKEEMAAMQEQNMLQNQNQQAIFSDTIRSLETQRDELVVQVQATQNELESVRGEKNQLEQDFKNLVAKINSNDAVIAQLKQNIEVLGQQNEQLLEKQNTLAAQNQQLISRNEDLAHQNEHLSSQQERLFEQNEELVEQNYHLSSQQEKLEHQLQEAHSQIELQRLEKEALQLSLAPTKPSAPVQPFVVPAAPVQPVRLATAFSKAPASPKPPVAQPVAKSSVVATTYREESPVEMDAQAKAKVKTEADLPEIKVADPEPLPDPALIDGEDFLEKTDNFIGRIKWSIFHEDR